MAEILKFDKDQFRKHMEAKGSLWKPLNLYIGEDFAVFEFEYMYEHDSARASVLHWYQSYGYSVFSDGSKKLVILNASPSELNIEDNTLKAWGY